MNEYRTTQTFEFDDFIDGDLIERKLDISWAVMNEVECDVSCTFVPEEGDHIEDLTVTYEGIEVTDDLNALIHACLLERLTNEV